VRDPGPHVRAKLAEHLGAQVSGLVLLKGQLRPRVDASPPFDDALVALLRQAFQVGAEIAAHRSSGNVGLALATLAPHLACPGGRHDRQGAATAGYAS
jgi:hypothetical protein